MNFKKVLFIIIGFLLLGIGTIGIIIPVLPTTPFVLVAATCFSIGSPRLQKMLLKSKFFGSYIKYYKSDIGVPVHIVRKSIIMVWIGLIISMILVRKLWLIIMLMIIGISVSIYLTTLIHR